MCCFIWEQNTNRAHTARNGSQGVSGGWEANDEASSGKKSVLSQSTHLPLTPAFRTCLFWKYGIDIIRGQVVTFFKGKRG